MKKNIDRYFKTTNLNLAVFLYAKDFQIAGINPVDRVQKEFVFTNSPILEEMIWLYRYGDRDDDRLPISPHKYEQARRELMDRLNDR